jgi:hypothetical protein
LIPLAAAMLAAGALLSACPAPPVPAASEWAASGIVAIDPVRPPSNPTAPVERRPVPVFGPLPAQTQLAGFNHEYQRLNNCGPVTIGMALSYYGRTETQYEIAPVLRPHAQDKNVSLGEMTWFASMLGFDAVMSPAGSVDLLKRLIAEGFPVIIHTWAVLDAGDDGVGHYQLATGYDQATGTITFHDSYRGPGVRWSFAQVDQDWRIFGRGFIVISEPARTAELRAIVGEADGTARAWQLAARVAEAELAAAPADAIAWFNLAEARLRLGNAAGAAQGFDEARRLGLPARMLWYKQGPIEAYAKAGRPNEAIALAEATMRQAGTLEELLFWRAHARIALGDSAGAASDLRAILDFNPRFEKASEARAILAELTS